LIVPHGLAAQLTCHTTPPFSEPMTCAANSTVPDGATRELAGQTLSARWAITVISAVALREVSALDVATTYTPAGLGTAAGAIYSTGPDRGPVGGAQGLEPATHICPTLALPFAVPSTLQVTAVLLLPCTFGVSVVLRPAATCAAVGVSVRLIPLTTVIVAEADCVESATLVATSITGFAGGIEAGAV
jgi:hypothetical protein